VHAARAFEDAATNAADGGNKGVVRLTGPVAFVWHVIVPLMGEFVRLQPEIRLDVRATNELIDLADEGIDLAFRSGSLSSVPGHLYQTWFSTPWVTCAAPSYLERRKAPRTVSELDAHDLIGWRNRTGRVEQWPHVGGSYEPMPRLAFDDGDDAWGAMLTGAGLACAPLYLAATALRNGTAVEVLAKYRAADVSVVMLRRDRRLAPARLTKVMEFLSARTPKLDDLRR